ncbi:1-deoxy-D-xylulose-5-phosphate reductoisomerase, partial [bacterium]|nr:1-deoxy-D-xylulose-5-phosphate reductoisomerase [bacterium]
MKRISILGSTGSIGVNTLRVIKSLGEGYKVVGLSARRNVNLLVKQIKEFKPEIVALM